MVISVNTVFKILLVSLYHMSHLVKKNHKCGFRTGPTQTELYKHRRWLEAGNLQSRELSFPCSENEGADQLRSYCEADLRLCLKAV